MILGSPHDVFSETPRQQKPPDNHNMSRIITVAPKQFYIRKNLRVLSKKSISGFTVGCLVHIYTPGRWTHRTWSHDGFGCRWCSSWRGPAPPYSSGFSSRFHLPEIVQFWKVTLGGVGSFKPRWPCEERIFFHLRPLVWFWRLSLWATELEGIKRKSLLSEYISSQNTSKTALSGWRFPSLGL